MTDLEKYTYNHHYKTMIASGNRIFLGMINGYIFKVLFSKLKNLVLKNDKVLNFCL